MANESPTRIRSAPASLTIRADGASYAVNMTNGSSPFRFLVAAIFGAVKAFLAIGPFS